MKDKYIAIKWVIFAALVIASVVVVTPTKEKIRYGLDLAGGTSFTVALDQEQILADVKAEKTGLSEAEAERYAEELMTKADSRTVEVLRNRIDGLGVNEPVITPGSNHRIVIEIPGADEVQRKAAEDSIKTAARLEFRLVHRDSAAYAAKLFERGVAPKGYTISPNGDFYVRDREAYAEAIKDPNYKRYLANFGEPPANHTFRLERDLHDGVVVYRPLYVRNKVELGGDHLTGADTGFDTTSGKRIVNLSFDREGTKTFGVLTTKYCTNGSSNPSAQGRQLAIILDDVSYSSPVLNEPITGGRAQISGSFTPEDAATLRNVLNAGSLPLPIAILEKRSIDASLGADAIHSGIVASVIASALVILFMLGYYLYYGLVADIALAVNIVLLPLGMILIAGIFGALGATDAATGAASGGLKLPVLTMPGLAGIVLTVGMAVDANVIIYERIREEARLGKTAGTAITAGYQHAFSAIFDSNITTLLTGVILFLFGSGPIRGFAITLSAGIIVSMFTALVLTRMIFTVTTKESRVTPYRMKSFFEIRKPFDFLSKGKLALIASGVLIAATIAIFAIRVKTNARAVMAIDFTGGTVASYTFENKPSIEDMKGALKGAGVDDAIIQTQTAVGEQSIVRVKSGYETIGDVPVGDAIDAALKKAFPESGIKQLAIDNIGPQIGSDLTKAAVKSVVIALICMIIYISLRFRFGFALGAVAALAHDVLLTLGLFTLFGRQIGTTAIACFLTIVGYSINDTVVIFDRIREDLAADPKASFRDIVNRSINQTLSRTMLTSLTTLLAVLALFLFGGGAINDFALCMLIGVVVGTYSTIFIATPIMVAWYKGRRPDAEKKAE